MLQLVLGVGEDKHWQTLAGVVEDVGDVVVGARPRPQGLVRSVLDTVKLLPELCMCEPKTVTLPHVRGLERIATQHVEQ